jgi:hypothetical protein
MSQVSPFLRRAQSAYVHWCPGCSQMHSLGDSWAFNGDLEKPTFTPSFKHGGVQCVYDAEGRWTGQWVLDALGKPVPYVCHYILTDGILHFCADSTHVLSGLNVSLPVLPTGYQDSDFP